MKHARKDYDRIQDPENKIGKDEPVMLFRAQDKHFVEVLQLYATLVQKDTEIETSVYEQIERAEKWQKENFVKEPDIN